MVTGHPPDPLLLEEPLRPEVERHLGECAACRIHRRRLIRALADVPQQTEGPIDPARFDLPARMFEDELGLHEQVWDRQEMRLVARVTLSGSHGLDAVGRSAARLQAPLHPYLGRTVAVLPGPPMAIVTELVAGTTLGTHDLAQDPRASAWLLQATSALIALHDAGLTHGHLTGRTVRILPHGTVVLTSAGLHPDARPVDDFSALAKLFDALPEPFHSKLHAAAQGSLTGPALLAWLASLRDPGAGGSSRYVRLEQIGEGGMGEVYRVADPVTGRSVAQKVLSKELITRPACIQRFVDEARIAAQLEHPGIVPVHDIEFLADGTVAFTMKLVQGQRLGDRIQQVHAASTGAWASSDDGWTLRRLVDALRRVCDATAYAHDQGIVHLDLKPDNVMLGDYGEVLLMDWGLARRLEDDGRVLASGGTPGFTAPELLDVEATRVDPTADVYGLGQILRQILDGRAPPVIPDAWQPARRDVPPELISIVRHATGTDPNGRYATARLMAHDLLAWLDGAEVASHPYSALQRLSRVLRPHAVPLTVAAIAAVVLAAVGLVAALQVSTSRSEANASAAQMRVEQARLALADGDRIAADRAAASALKLAELPEARGLLARLALGWRPTRLESWPAPCRDAVAVGSDALFCTTPGGSQAWSRPGTPEPAIAGRLDHVRRSNDHWSALAHGDVVLGDATGQRHTVFHGTEPLADALVRSDGTVVTALGETIVAHPPDATPVELARTGANVVGLSDCSDQGVVAVCEDGSVVHIDAEGEVYTLFDLRATAPLACSPDGRQIAIATVDHEVQLWRLLPRMKQRHLLQGHLDAVRDLDWSPRGDQLATASDDGTVRLWAARTGEERGRLSDHDDVAGVSFLDEESLLTVARGVARVWRVPAEPPPDHVSTHVASQGLWWGQGADGRLLVVHDRVGRASIYAADTGQALASDDSLYAAIAVAPQGRRIAGGNEHGDVTVVDLNADRPVVWRVDKTHPGGVTAIAWHPSLDRIASADRMGAVRLWESDGQGSVAQRDLTTLDGGVVGLAWSADGSTLVANTGTSITLIRADNGEQHTVQRSAPVFAATGDGAGVLIAPTEGGLVRVDRDGRLVRTYPVQGRVVGVAQAPDRDRIASVSSDGLVQVFDGATGTELARVATTSRNATDIQFSRDGQRLATAGVDGEVMLLDTSVLDAPASALNDLVRVRYGAFAARDAEEAP